MASAGRPNTSFEARALEVLGLQFTVRAAPGAAIPPSGPLIVAANHPTGASDGLVLVEAVRQVRPDARLLSNYLLARIPELADSCFFVDPFGGRAASARSHGGLRGAHSWLRGGGALIVFPSGEVAFRRSPGLDTRVDSPWGSTVGRLALATDATVLPAFLDGSNSPWFYAAGTVQPLLRSLLLPRELLRRRGTTTRVFIGGAIPPARGAAAQTAVEKTSAIRANVDALARWSMDRPGTPVPTARSVPAALLTADIEGLTDESRLLRSGDFDVYCADATDVPHVLREIGRLRELAFRAVGEGTGRETDLDAFDDHYQHLFVWNRVRREVAGAYRIGATDRILASKGSGGLYTTTLFRYDERLLSHLAPALELGRSFVRQDYQRGSNVLLLLWRGIGTLVARAPRYRRLFGPVSISNRYSDTSQQILRVFLADHHCEPRLAQLVEPINPPRPIDSSFRKTPGVSMVGDVEQLVRTLERGTGIPVLLRQYLRLGATLLGFNVDPSFGDALDALMMVDLTRLPIPMLRRYLGSAEADAFLAWHHTPAGTRRVHEAAA